MLKLIRRYLIPALIVALTGTGVSFAAAGGIHTTDDDQAPVVSPATESPEVETTTHSDDPTEGIVENEEEPENNEAPEAEHTPKPRFTEGCGESFDGNHGAYVSHSEDKQAAAHSDCGKPLTSVDKGKSKDEHGHAGPQNGEHGPNEHANEHAFDHSGDGDDGGD